MSPWFRSTPESEALLEEERLVLSATEAVYEAMEEKGVNGRQLAERLGVRPSEVSQRLSGRRNLTLRSFAAMLHVLGMRAKITIEPVDTPFVAGVQSNVATNSLQLRMGGALATSVEWLRIMNPSTQPVSIDLQVSYQSALPAMSEAFGLPEIPKDFGRLMYWDGHQTVGRTEKNEPITHATFEPEPAS